MLLAINSAVWSSKRLHHRVDIEKGNKMSVFPDIFTELAALLLLAAVVGALGVRLRQPLIVALLP